MIKLLYHSNRKPTQMVCMDLDDAFENADRVIAQNIGWPVAILDEEGNVILDEGDILKRLIKG